MARYQFNALAVVALVGVFVTLSQPLSVYGQKDNELIKQPVPDYTVRYQELTGAQVAEKLCRRYVRELIQMFCVFSRRNSRDMQRMKRISSQCCKQFCPVNTLSAYCPATASYFDELEQIAFRPSKAVLPQLPPMKMLS